MDDENTAPQDDGFIELPPEPKPTFTTFAGDQALGIDDMLALMGDAKPIERRPDVMADTVAQDPVLTDRTLEEAAAGKAAVSPLLAMLSVPDTVQIAKTRQQEQLEAEQAAGREVIARKQAEMDRGKQIMRAAAAQRLRENAPASNDDLG